MAIYRKKMIEVSIPLDAINVESALRKRKAPSGYPTTLHSWWAQRPLASCRAVLFCALIDDPGEAGVPTELLDGIDALPAPEMPREEWDALDIAEQRRQRLFRFIGDLVKWENTTKDEIWEKAAALIGAATGGSPPPILDPFCGGGSIPLEAQRLGLETFASDLNPVAVLLTKALIEIPPRFSRQSPVNPDDAAGGTGGGARWRGATALAADVRWYGRWMSEQAWQRVGHLYPKAPNGEPVVAWLWARTVKCPNPACGAEMPLVRSFVVSTTKGRETWVHAAPDRTSRAVAFEVRTGGKSDQASSGTKVGPSDFACVVCASVADARHIRAEGMAGRMGAVLIAAATEGERHRGYVSPYPGALPQLTSDEEMRVQEARTGALVGATPERLTGGTCYGYGLTTWASLFTPRQLVVLTTLSDLVLEARDLVRKHALAASLDAPTAESYADGVATYLAFAVDRCADYGSSLASWRAKDNALRSTLGIQALPMVWDYAEANPFGLTSGGFVECTKVVARAVEFVPARRQAEVTQLDAAQAIGGTPGVVIATDPPYYDNIGYSDLADFYYVWLRRSIGRIYPSLFATMLTPKQQEIVAAPYRFAGGQDAADSHFEMGLSNALGLIRAKAHPEVPTTLYYAYKQAESNKSGVASTGWEKMLSGLLLQGFEITGTWPLRTEGDNRRVGQGTNALASSIVLTCRPRPEDAALATLQEFQRAVGEELPLALEKLIRAHIAPVDLAQAAIGPGMAVLSRYSRVIEPNGNTLNVRRALELINEHIEHFFAQREGAYDAETQFCLRWFQQYGPAAGPYGQAEVLATAKAVSVRALADILQAEHGNVQLYGVDEYVDYYESYDPSRARRVTAWEACHYLAAAFRDGGETAAATLARRLGGLAQQGVDLAYRLYNICDANHWSQEARAYNELADGWPTIQQAMARLEGTPERQAGLL